MPARKCRKLSSMWQRQRPKQRPSSHFLLQFSATYAPPSSPLPFPFPSAASCRATNGIFIDISLGLPGSFGCRMLKYARHLLILFADWGRSLSAAASGSASASASAVETRDLQHKLKARAMHINSNLDRRIKANDFDSNSDSDSSSKL